MPGGPAARHIGDQNVIHDFEISPLLVQAHRDYLRSLYHPVPAGVGGPKPRRKAPGQLLIRIARRLLANRPATQPATLDATTRPV